MVATILVAVSVLVVLAVCIILMWCLFDDFQKTKDVAKLVGLFAVLGALGACALVFVAACVNWFVNHVILLV